MKKFMLIALAALLTVPFFGCKKKEETLGDKIDKAVESTKGAAKEAGKEAEKAADAAAKKVEEVKK